MSLFRLPKLRRIASSAEHFCSRLMERRSARSVTERSYRRLAVDPLEARHLLSVTPMGPTDHLVNESFIGDLADDFEVYDQDAMSGQSVAVDLYLTLGDMQPGMTTGYQGVRDGLAR